MAVNTPELDDGKHQLFQTLIDQAFGGGDEAEPAAVVLNWQPSAQNLAQQLRGAATGAFEALMAAKTQVGQDMDANSELDGQANTVLAALVPPATQAKLDAIFTATCAIQHAAQEGITRNESNQTRTGHERLHDIMVQIERLDEKINDRFQQLMDMGYQFDPEDIARRAAILAEQERIRRENPNGYLTDPRYIALERQKAPIEHRMQDQAETQLAQRGSPPEEAPIVTSNRTDITTRDPLMDQVQEAEQRIDGPGTSTQGDTQPTQVPEGNLGTMARVADVQSPPPGTPSAGPGHP